MLTALATVVFSTLAAVRAPDSAAAGFFETLIHAITDPPATPAARGGDRASRRSPFVRRPNAPPKKIAAKASPEPLVVKSSATLLVAKASPKPQIEKASPQPLMAKAWSAPSIAKESPKPPIAKALMSRDGNDVARLARPSERQRMARAVALARPTWGLRTDGQRLTGVQRRKDATDFVVTAVGHDYRGDMTMFRMVVREWYGMQLVRSDDAVAATPPSASTPSPLAAQ